MITVPAHKVRQFGVEFYQTSFTSADIQKLVKFEVLNYPTMAEEEKGRKPGKSAGSHEQRSCGTQNQREASGTVERA